MRNRRARLIPGIWIPWLSKETEEEEKKSHEVKRHFFYSTTGPMSDPPTVLRYIALYMLNSCLTIYSAGELVGGTEVK